ncbi:hypothetical protein [Bifidobacterium goeldii]|nr:hypothetical protein [Bifidobacterium goeldii]
MRTNRVLTDRCIETERQRLYVWGRTAAERKMLRRREQAGELIRVHNSWPCYARADSWNMLNPVEQYRRLVRTLALQHPSWLFGDMTAAAMYGINDSLRHMNAVHIMTNRSQHSHNWGSVRYHLLTDAERSQCAVVDGVRVTSLGRTVFDCARRLDFPDGMCVVESVLRNRLMSRSGMREHCQTLSGKFRAKALRVVDQAPGGTENGGEAYTYAVIVDEGFMAPHVQEVIIDQHDLSRSYRVDFSWHTSHGRFIVAELDGRVKYRDPSMLKNGSLEETIISEKEREENIRLQADEVVRLSFGDAYHRQRLIWKLEKAGVPRVPRG